MANIVVLDQGTIDKIAAGEVIERPASVVKELMENAIDAKASAITVEIKEGGTSLIRITDNGCGIPKNEVQLAFMRHATSKIRSVEDLITVSSLGFRGEALSSIAAVAQVELITKTADSVTGTRYQIEGGQEKSIEEIGAPEGTTFLVRNLFYNTPVRRKFLKTPMAEGSHVAELVERLALSRPDISVRFIYNNQNRLHTAGNHNLKDIIYTVYGREIASNLLEVSADTDLIQIHGFVGKPVIARGNRNFENYFINGRYIKSSLIYKAIEDAYKPYMMQHKYPFTVLHFTIEPSLLDVNVHPTKMELRFRESEKIYQIIQGAISQALGQRELIPKVGFGASSNVKKEAAEPKRESIPEPFERRRMESMVRETPRYSSGERPSSEHSDAGVKAKDWARQTDVKPGAAGRQSQQDMAAGGQTPGTPDVSRQKAPRPENILAQQAFLRPESTFPKKPMAAEALPEEALRPDETSMSKEDAASKEDSASKKATSFREDSSSPKDSSSRETDSGFEQIDLFENKLLSREAAHEHRIIGQVFDTYWLVEYKDSLYFIDQHAAHEKVLYEKTMASLAKREYTSQMVSPPIILTLTPAEETLLREHKQDFEAIGFEIEPFGGKEYAVSAVPDNLFSLAKKELLMEMLDSLSGDAGLKGSEMILEKVASMSCKAAVKGGNRLTVEEADKLIEEQLMELENPYNCPHGRPIIVSMSRREIEKYFKRIL